MKKIFKYLVVAAITAGISSCEDYLDVNTDPSNPTSDSVNPDLQLAGVMVESYGNIMPGSANRLGNIYMQSWAADATNFTGAFLDEYSLSMTASFYQVIWNNIYLYTDTYSSIIRQNSSTYANHVAIAKIMKAYYFQYLVDLYGDIPYAEAHLGGANLTPAYQDDEEIYGELLDLINTATATINNTPAGAIAVGAEDVIMNGDMNMWLKFANTLKLRLLLRQESTGIYNSQFSDLDNAQFIGLGEDVTINPGYANATGKQNPFYGQFFNTEAGIEQNRTLLVATDYAMKFLNGGVTENAVSTGVYDKRLEMIYESGDDGYVGFQQGENSIPGNLKPSKIGPGLVKSSTQDGYIMTASEALFLQSEAVEKGLIVYGTSAKDLFQDGIRSSYTLLGLDLTDANAYIGTSNGTNLIGWDGSGNKTEAIMTQKWIALNGIHGIESWIEYTRTGFPNVPLTTIAARPARPNRLLYPSTELSSNSANVPAQTADTAFNTNVFWD
jgi:hypothetical protein